MAVLPFEKGESYAPRTLRVNEKNGLHNCPEIFREAEGLE
jgi:hypothetical protein